MNKVVVGMSGGVDSSVSALLLKNQGYDVTGLFMKNWEEDDTADYCSAKEDLKDAEKVCAKIGIPLLTMNFAAEYWDNVFEHFLAELKAGRTPNPDILCNREIKFKAFLDYAKVLGADYIATGHYVAKSELNGAAFLHKGHDANKDQSYFLYAISQHALQKSLFPLGELCKTEVRRIATENNFINSQKKDSTGICFIGERKFADFIKNYLGAQPGNIMTEHDEIIGRHNGLMYYTIGQRQGLHIGGNAKYSELPWFVSDKDIKSNNLIVVQGNDNPKLFKNNLICSQDTWINTKPILPFNCTAKTRYRQPDQKCCISQQSNGNLLVEFEDAQRAITPGQSIVFYDNDICLGGAIIN